MKYLFKIGFLFCIIFLVCACSKSMSGGNALSASYAGAGTAIRGQTMNQAIEDSGFTRYEADERPHAPLFAEENAAQTLYDRKLVKSASLRLRVDDPAAMEKPLAELMEKYGAWTASTAVYENSRDYTIRVPSFSYDVMLAELAGLGRMVMRRENTEDVTLRYYDLEGRLSTKRELLKTYQSYLGRANNIDEIMTVESRIADLQWEIDQTGTQFRNLANLIDYSTIDMGITGPAGASPYADPTLGEKLKELFGSFGNVASSALMVLMGIIIYGVPAVLIFVLLFWILFGRIGLLKKLWRLAVRK